VALVALVVAAALVVALVVAAQAVALVAAALPRVARTQAKQLPPFHHAATTAMDNAAKVRENADGIRMAGWTGSYTSMCADVSALNRSGFTMRTMTLSRYAGVAPQGNSCSLFNGS